MALANTIEKNTQPWWKYGYVWLVVSGPAVVVVAGFYTLYLAISSPNQVLTEGNDRSQVEVSQSINNQGKNLMPALKGRNHAATPVIDRPNN